MLNEPRKLVYTGLLVGAAAVAAYVAQSDRRWLPTDELSLERDGASSNKVGGNMTGGSVSSGPVTARGASDTALSGKVLQAARNSVLRNDLAAARAQLDAVHAALRSDQQALALQSDVDAEKAQQAQQEQSQQPVTVARSDAGTEQEVKPTHTAHSPKLVHTKTRTRETQVAAAGTSHHASGRASTQHAPETIVVGTARAVGAQAAGKSASAAASAPVAMANATATATATAAAKTENDAPVVAVASRSSTEAPAASGQMPRAAQTELTARTDRVVPVTQAPSAQPVAQFASNNGSAFKTVSSGPKTRAEVRAEIVRARSDGSLPPFGNPDPAGPGGAPSMTIPTGH